MAQQFFPVIPARKRRAAFTRFVREYDGKSADRACIGTAAVTNRRAGYQPAPYPQGDSTFMSRTPARP
jgi:hypothetical protein